MTKVTVEENTYEIINDHKEAFNEESFKEKCTDYFYDYDYIVGDIAYGKLRLKGFYEETNKKVNNINNYNNLSDYLTNNCAVDCRYFVAKKINNNK